MNAWPSTLPLPDWDCEEEDYKPQIKDEFEANYVQTGPAASRSRSKFPLGWHLMTEAEYQILKAFRDANQGSCFTYTHPIAATSHVCVFTGNSIKSKWGPVGHRSDVQCPIEEV
jgi:hypothetical protein